MNLTAKIGRILVPIDFSRDAEVACHLAARLAMRAEADLVLFHALPGAEMVRQVESTMRKTQVAVLNDIREELRTWFEIVVPVDVRQFLKAEFTVKVGEPTPGIALAAKRSRADLILMATKGRTGVAHLLMGSVTEAVLRTVSIPVLALRLGQGDRPLAKVQRILWATDLSPVSEGAWRYALTFADVLAAEIILLHVVRPSDLAGVADHPVPPPAGWTERYLTHLEEELARREEAVEALGLRARRKVLVGVPAEVIVAEARTEEADLIVMGTHGRTGLSHILLGSVAEVVIRRAPCPVLAVQVRVEAGVGERDPGEEPAEAGAAGRS